MLAALDRAMRRFAADASGNMLVLSALSMPVVIGCAGLAVEYGSAVGLRAENQRISDLAAYAGAVAYSKEESEDRMRAAALAVVALNGGNPADASVSLVASPLDPAALAVRVDMAGVQPAFLSAILNDVVAIPVSSGSTAILGRAEEEEGGACVVALDASQSGITLSGGTTLNAPDCAIASNAAIGAPCGTRISALRVTYGSTLANCIWDNNVRETVARQSVTDPLAGHSGIAAAWARLSSVNAMQWPLMPTALSGTDVHFEGGWNQSTAAAVKAKMPHGCSAAWSAPKWTVDCSGVQSGRQGREVVGVVRRRRLLRNGRLQKRHAVRTDDGRERQRRADRAAGLDHPQRSLVRGRGIERADFRCLLFPERSPGHGRRSGRRWRDRRLLPGRRLPGDAHRRNHRGFELRNERR